MNNQITDDIDLYNLINEETQRQKCGLELIASENFTSSAVMKILGSISMESVTGNDFKNLELYNCFNVSSFDCEKCCTCSGSIGTWYSNNSLHTNLDWVNKH